MNTVNKGSLHGPVNKAIRRIFRKSRLPGRIIAIVWGTQYAGVSQEHSGVVITQRQYGMRVHPFDVSTTNPRTINFLGLETLV